MLQRAFKTVCNIQFFLTLIFAWSSLFLSFFAHANNGVNSQIRSPIAIPSNLNPFILILGLPTAENGSLTSVGKLHFQGSFSMVNNSNIEIKGNESITLDGASNYSLFSFKYGLNDRWEIGFKIPYIAHGVGFLDDFIKDWHNIVGLSNYKRNIFDDNELLYNYSFYNQTGYELLKNERGWGDPSITAAARLSGNHPTRNIALRFSAKLPLGSADRLTGNEASNLSIALAFDDILHIFSKKISFIGQAGYLYLDDGEVLKKLQRNQAGFGSLGLNFPFSKNIIIKTQIDAQGSFYDSELLALGKESIQFTLGAGISAISNIWIDFGIVENLLTDTTPDVTFYTAIYSILEDLQDLN